MLTRLKVKGFKNLQDVDVRFGPFTCVAGPNGVGKSNLFDAIHFLSLLADKTFVEAAAAVRGPEGRVGDVSTLFWSDGERVAEEMSFEVEMIIPAEGTDDLGASAKASYTFLRYQLALRRRADLSHAAGPLELVHEHMTYIKSTEAKASLKFHHKKAWRDSVVLGRRTAPYIHTERPGSPVGDDASTDPQKQTQIKIHADTAGGGGNPRTVLATTMPRTALSTTNVASEHRTLVLARKEMMGWTQLQLEPSALRSPDTFSAPRGVTPNGGHLPATLRALAVEQARAGEVTLDDVYTQVANRLSDLYENVRFITVEEDPKRELYSIVLEDLHGARHRASALSDGTLRFLALTIIEMSGQGPNLLCLEEPENGIHPDRLPSMLRLVKDIAVRTEEKVGPENPLRQVIINTHSKDVVALVDHDALLLVDVNTTTAAGRVHRRVQFGALKNTWRHANPSDGESAIALIPYGRPYGAAMLDTPRPGHPRVRDREDAQQLGLFGATPTGSR